MSGYCSSRFATVRRPSREVFVGNVGVGGENPIRIQSMTTTNTQDVSATVAQSITLAEAGCEIIRITAPNKKAAQALKEIHRKFRNAGFNNPLVADIHFLPSAAMEAVEHVEKVRVNPGNYADNKKFAIREYSDSQYLDELERLHEEFSPLVMRAKELGRSMRVGCNHGSLSDRIMNRYGDTPLGMVESVLEFLRIAEKHSYQDIILSMKSSNPKVMIEAYRLLVEKMDAEGMSYPLHLGVTEAGDGEDGRIKSAIGIGSLLMDGLGDTIRVSLTEDPIYEIPVAEALARKAMKQWAVRSQPDDKPDSIDPYSFSRRVTNPVELAPNIRVNSETPPSVITRSATPITKPQELSGELKQTSLILSDTPIESLWIRLDSPEDFETIPEASRAVSSFVPSLTLEIAPEIDLQSLSKG
ncbi:MAG: (E)-4-hydroxy-3-methylbut-2-enyl-diphosphate synthase, partial [Opitutales bacterium]|nr:(E)-4-hydroxy-3-methylbut-2-enyl-diphosphate synthase [Opitutales bacterium]